MPNRKRRRQRTTQRLEPDPIVARVLTLRERRQRQRSGLFFVEGVRFVKQALDAGYKPTALITCAALMRSALGETLADRLDAAGVPHRRVSPTQFGRLTTSKEPQGIGLVLRRRVAPLAEREAPPERAVWVGASRVRSPGNLGTILRTAEAAGVRGLMLLGDAVDPYEPGTVRASMGGLFHLDLRRTSVAGLRRWADVHGVRIVGASGDALCDYRAAQYGPRCVVLLGDERKGLTDAERAACDTLVRIPMIGSADSLNIGVAAGLVLYEATRGI